MKVANFNKNNKKTIYVLGIQKHEHMSINQVLSEEYFEMHGKNRNTPEVALNCQIFYLFIYLFPEI